MTSFCTGTECPHIEKAKLEMYKEISSVVEKKVEPMVLRFEKASTDLAVHAEKLMVGATQFDDHGRRLTIIEDWRNQSLGAEKANRRSGARWAIFSSAACTALFEYLSKKYMGG